MYELRRTSVAALQQLLCFSSRPFVYVRRIQRSTCFLRMILTFLLFPSLISETRQRRSRILLWMYRVGQKKKSLRLTIYIFEMTEAICVIFGTIQQSFVLNTSVNSTLNKFVTPVTSPIDKINNSVSHLQNQARPLHSNAHVFKIPEPICTIFGTTEHRDIVNMHVTSFSSIA